MKSVLVIRPSARCGKPVVLLCQETGGTVIMAGMRGATGIGIPGPAGGSTLQRRAGETISALRAVYERNDRVFYLDPQDDAHIDLLLGVAITSASTDQLLNVQRSGVIDDIGWNWSLGSIWLGPAGVLTQTPPTAGYDVLIGAAVSSTRITLNLQDPIELE